MSTSYSGNNCPNTTSQGSNAGLKITKTLSGGQKQSKHYYIGAYSNITDFTNNAVGDLEIIMNPKTKLHAYGFTNFTKEVYTVDGNSSTRIYQYTEHTNNTGSKMTVRINVNNLKSMVVDNMNGIIYAKCTVKTNALEPMVLESFGEIKACGNNFLIWVLLIVLLYCLFQLFSKK